MPSILESTEARAYRDLGRAYCAIVEGRAVVSPSDWLKAIHQILPALYSAASALPDVEPDSDGNETLPDSSAEGLSVEIGGILGSWDTYSLMFDPYSDKEPVLSSLAGDLAEIYEDVRQGERHESTAAKSRPSDVMWQWRFAFVSHWGRHAACALTALHAALFTHYADHAPETFGQSDGSERAV